MGRYKVLILHLATGRMEVVCFDNPLWAEAAIDAVTQHQPACEATRLYAESEETP